LGRSRSFLDRSHPTHVTIRIMRGLPSLRRRDLAKAIGESLRKGKQKAGFRVVHFSIQANHLHLIIEATGRLMLWRG
jgi:REP element-mobilizing transposase RayT